MNSPSKPDPAARAMTPSTDHVETWQRDTSSKAETSPVVLTDEEKKNQQADVDYSGASRKVDPAEIALVRKLDRRILPMLCAMYFLNYVRKSYPTF